MAAQVLYGSLAVRTTIMVVVVATFIFVGGSTGWQYTVGDSVWSIPPTNFFYTNWSSSHTFHAGDSLLFEFDSELYNVMQVSRAEYEACTANHPLKALTEGPAVVTLIEEGVFYYICSILNYCGLGQKLSVTTVHQNSSSPTPAPLLAI